MEGLDDKREFDDKTEQELLEYIDSLGTENPEAQVCIGSEHLSAAQMRVHVKMRTKTGLLLLGMYVDDRDGDDSDFE